MGGPGALAVGHLGFGWREDCCPEQEEELGQVPQLGVQRSPTGMGRKGGLPLQTVHCTSQVNEREKDSGSLLCPKWRGCICPLGP